MISLRRLLRSWMRNKLLVFQIVLILAFGLGANIAIFGVYNAAFVQLPLEDPGRIVALTTISRGADKSESFVSVLDLEDWRTSVDVFDSVALYDSGSGVILAGGMPERVAIGTVSSNFFSVLGVHPEIGSLFSAADENGDAADIVISDHLWRTMMNANTEAIGRSIKIGESTYMVRGVLPAYFRLFDNADVWIRFQNKGDEPRGGRHFVGLARLKPGRSLSQANAELKAVSARLQNEHPDTNRGVDAFAQTLRSYLSHNFTSSFVLLFMTALLVLVIAIFNVANLFGVYLQSSQKEQAIELALGCSRAHLRNRLVAEFLALACIAGLLGLAVAYTILNVVMQYAPDTLISSRHYLDLTVYGFAFVAAVFAGLLATLMSFLSVSRANIVDVIKGTGSKFGGNLGFRSLPRLLFLVFEVGMSVVLLVTAGLFTKSFLLMQRVNTGFQSQNLLTARIQLPSSQYRDRAQRALFWDQLLTNLSRLPDVSGVACMTGVPLSGAHMNFRFTADAGRDVPVTGLAEYKAISPGIFRLLGIPLQHGRSFLESDGPNSLPVIIINESMAQTIFGSENPVGKHLVVSYGDKKSREIVGVVGDVKYSDLAEKVKNQVYVPYSQNPWPFMTLIVRTSVPPTSVAVTLRREVFAMDKELPLQDVRTMDDIVYLSMARGRFAGILIFCFAGLALILAATGIYGVISFAVAQRSREIAIRIALGAPRNSVLQLFIRQSLAVIALGAALGLLASFFSTRLFQSLLYKVKAVDLEVILFILSLLLAVGMLACILPATKATRIEPDVVMRSE